MGLSAGGDVRFDYDGSLALARRLWSYADELDRLRAGRHASATSALHDWLGRYGTEFAERTTTDLDDLARVAGDLRGAATGWGAAWAAAINEQNRRIHAREVVRITNARDWRDDVAGFFFGHDDLPPEPRPLGAPQPPWFAPTGSFLRY